MPRGLPRLGREVQSASRRKDDPRKRLRQATVAAVASDGTVTLAVNGGMDAGFPVLAPYVPVVGDVVEVVRDGPDWLVLGPTGARGAGPRGVLGYKEANANQSGITAITDLANLSTTLVLDSARRIRVTGQVLVESTVAGDLPVLYAMVGATRYRLDQVRLSAANVGEQAHGQRVLVPTGGSTTIKLQVGRFGTGTVQMDAGNEYPAFLLIEDIGIAPT